MSEDKVTAVERFSNKVRHVMGVLGFVLLVVVAGGLAVAFYVDPLAAVAYVVVVSAVAGMVLPRFL